MLKATIPLTGRLVATMDLIGVRTLDHIIVANNQSQNLDERGHV
jgi:DNA repair protein RadC